MLMQDDESVRRAFSKQAGHFDHDDLNNKILQDLRHQVYVHVDRNLREPSRILELNAGTGIDALHFVAQGHSVHATDLSDGMIAILNGKISDNNLGARLTSQQLSFTQLDKVVGAPYDAVFSNFGGLNCLEDLEQMTRFLPHLLRKGGVIILVIMPPVYIWEFLGILKGNHKAFRRLKRNGVTAHLEGEYFKTWYHSLSDIQRALGRDFILKNSEGLAALSPPPHRGDFPHRYPRTYQLLRNVDHSLGRKFPFNRWADHIVTTFQRKG